jgi:hypothetical protein
VHALFSRKREPSNPTVLMANTPVLPAPEHKHLGIILQSNGKWNSQIEDLVCRASRRIDVLRSLKWRLDRKSLNKLYATYVRPILESGSCVWINCTKAESEKLEKQQLAAARVVTGAKKGTSHNELYDETGWQTLSARRVNQSLVLLFKMMRNEASEQLTALLPERTGQRTEYEIRTVNDLTVPRSRSVSHQNSFLPSTCRRWNKLPDEIKYCNSIEEMKSKLKGDGVQVPQYYNIGERKYQILQCQMRVKNANLKANLFAKGLAESPECDCGELEETTEHYLLECPLFSRQCRDMIRKLPGNIQLTEETLLKGDQRRDNRDNKKIMEEIQKFIKNSERFE